MFYKSGFTRTLCGSKWESLSGIYSAFNETGSTSTARLGCCPAGTFMANPHLNPFNQTSACESCPDGKFSAQPDDTNYNVSCIDCPIGQSNANAGTGTNTNCDSCPPGRILINYQNLDCQICPIGYYQNQTHLNYNITCHFCQSGKYIADNRTDDTEHISCKMCPLGHQYRSKTEACTVCGGGRYRGEVTVDPDCKLCPANTFNADNADKAEFHDNVDDCMQCDDGTRSTEGSRFCQNCPAGKKFIRTDANTTNCTDCTAGRYQPLGGQKSCLNCSIGKYQAEDGLPYCLPCIPGTYENQNGSKQCTMCGAG